VVIPQSRDGELTRKESRAAWDAVSQTERSAAIRVQESRADDCIKLKAKSAALEALVGSPKRIDLVAADLVKHYERRLEATSRLKRIGVSAAAHRKALWRVEPKNLAVS
jgi:hypothetical protein